MKLHGVLKVHGYKIGRHWQIAYALLAAFYRMRRLYRKPDYSEHIVIMRLDPKQAAWQLAMLNARLSIEERRNTTP